MLYSRIARNHPHPSYISKYTHISHTHTRQLALLLVRLLLHLRLLLLLLLLLLMLHGRRIAGRSGNILSRLIATDHLEGCLFGVGIANQCGGGLEAAECVAIGCRECVGGGDIANQRGQERNEGDEHQYQRSRHRHKTHTKETQTKDNTQNRVYNQTQSKCAKLPEPKRDIFVLRSKAKVNENNTDLGTGSRVVCLRGRCVGGRRRRRLLIVRFAGVVRLCRRRPGTTVAIVVRNGRTGCT